MALTKNWNSTFEAQPPDTDNPKYGDDYIRETRAAVRERTEREHVWGTSETYTGHGWHRPGSAMAFCQAAAPTTLNDTDSGGGSGLTALGNNTVSIGRLWVDTDTAIMYYWNGTAWTALAGTDPVGTVKFFHGTWVDNVTIPGWYECTAANVIAQGTIDLAGKFIMGVALATYTYGATGGSATALYAHTHTGPSHTHTGPSHVHLVSMDTSESGSHQHYIIRYDTGASAGLSASNYCSGYSNVGNDFSYAATLGTSSAANIGLTSSSATHYHSLASNSQEAGTGATGAGGTGATGSTGSTDSLPPYVVLHAIERRS